MIIGYARVSTDGQTLDAQQSALAAAGSGGSAAWASLTAPFACDVATAPKLPMVVKGLPDLLPRIYRDCSPSQRSPEAATVQQMSGRHAYLDGLLLEDGNANCGISPSALPSVLLADFPEGEVDQVASLRALSKSSSRVFRRSSPPTFSSMPSALRTSRTRPRAPTIRRLIPWEPSSVCN
jgi:hypothetical protein